MRVPRRGFLAAGAGLAGLALLAAVLILATDIGTPQDHYAAAPDACDLLDDDIVRELVGASWETDSTAGGGEPGMLYRAATVHVCNLAGLELGDGTVLASAYRFYSNQFHLGPDGEARAEEIFQAAQAVSVGEAGECPYRPPRSGAAVCGVRDNAGFDLHVQSHNVYVSLRIIATRSAEPSGQRLDQLMADAAGQVLSKLESPPSSVSA